MGGSAAGKHIHTESGNEQVTTSEQQPTADNGGDGQMEAELSELLERELSGLRTRFSKLDDPGTPRLLEMELLELEALVV